MKKLVVMLMVVCVSGFVSAGVLYSDDFSGDLSNYDYNGSPSIVNGELVQPATSYIRTRTAGDSPSVDVLGGTHAEIWAEYDFKLSGTPGWYDYMPTPCGKYSEFGLSFKTIAYSASAGNFRLIVTDWDGSSTRYTYYDEYALDEWHHFLVGAKITDPTTGNGIYSIYYDDGTGLVEVAKDVAFLSSAPFNGNDVYGRIQMLANQSGTTRYLDNLVIYDANPIPEPMTMALLGLGGVLLRRRK